MKNPKEKSTAILAGAAAGAILMALMFMIVFGLHTGIAGAVLVLLIVAVSAISGWLIGWKDSIKSLTYQEACAVIARLEELQGKTVSPKPRSSKPKEHETRPGGVTSGQQKKIWFLMYELKKCDEVPNDVQLGDRLCAVIKKEFGADAVASNPFAWITFEQGNNLIEILKRYVASARKRGEA